MIYDKIVKESLSRKDKKSLRDEHFITKYLFSQIDKTKCGFVSGKEVYSFIKSERDAIIFFELNLETFENDINKIDTKRPGLFNFNEFTDFLRV